jgi:hypothetical protein
MSGRVVAGRTKRSRDAVGIGEIQPSRKGSKTGVQAAKARLRKECQPRLMGKDSQELQLTLRDRTDA